MQVHPSAPERVSAGTGEQGQRKPCVTKERCGVSAQNAICVDPEATLVHTYELTRSLLLFWPRLHVQP